MYVSVHPQHKAWRGAGRMKRINGGSWGVLAPAPLLSGSQSPLLTPEVLAGLARKWGGMHRMTFHSLSKKLKTLSSSLTPSATHMHTHKFPVFGLQDVNLQISRNFWKYLENQQEVVRLGTGGSWVSPSLKASVPRRVQGPLAPGGGWSC